MSVAQAAVRRCHRVVLSATFGAVAFGAAVAAVGMPAAAPGASVLATTAADLLAISRTLPTAALPAETAILVPRPTPKPESAIAAITAAQAVPAQTLAHTEMTCLAEAVYYEARGESTEGQRAVAEVVLRRTKDHRFPNSVCGVVYQGAHKRNACQFSFACDGITRGRRDRKAWARAVEAAEYEAKGEGSRVDSTSGAQYFHTVKVNPSWSRRFIRTARIGSHIFYRQPGGSYEANNGAVPAS